MLGSLARNRNVPADELTAWIAEHTIEGNADKIVVPTLFLTSCSDVAVPHLLVEPTIARLQEGGRHVTVYVAEESPHGFYWGRGNVDSHAGPTTSILVEEEGTVLSPAVFQGVSRHPGTLNGREAA